MERIWLLTIEALDGANTPVTLRFASGAYIDPSNNYYDLRIKQPALFTSAAYTGAIIKEGSRSAFGETTLVNADGGLDYLADYATDGRASVLSLRDENGVITPVITGTVKTLAFSKNTISVFLRDPQEVLNLNHPHTVYAGSNSLPNGLEGVVGDIKGKVKPKVYGKVRNLSPIFVNTSKLAYQFHDDTTSPSVTMSIVAVYDRGVALTTGNTHASEAAFIAATVAAGTYDIYKGYFRLGTTPTGTVTCDIDSSKYLMGDVFDLLATEAGFTFNTTDKTTLNGYGEVGIFMPDVRTTSSFFDLLSSSMGGYWYFTSGTAIRAKQLIAPASPTSTFLDWQITAIDRESTGAGENGIPVWSVKLQADKVETVQEDLAASVSAVYKARIANQYRESVSQTASVKTRHPLSKELLIEGCLRNLSDATTQSNRIQTLLGVRRDIVTTTVRLDTDTIPIIEIGSVVNIKTYKLGYSSGKDFVVLGYTLDARLSRATLNLFG